MLCIKSKITFLIWSIIYIINFTVSLLNTDSRSKFSLFTFMLLWAMLPITRFIKIYFNTDQKIVILINTIPLYLYWIIFTYMGFKDTFSISINGVLNILNTIIVFIWSCIISRVIWLYTFYDKKNIHELSNIRINNDLEININYYKAFTVFVVDTQRDDLINYLQSSDEGLELMKTTIGFVSCELYIDDQDATVLILYHVWMSKMDYDNYMKVAPSEYIKYKNSDGIPIIKNKPKQIHIIN